MLSQAPKITDRRILRERALLGLEDAFYLGSEIIGLSRDELPRPEQEVRPFYDWLARPRPASMPKHQKLLLFWSSARFTGKTYTFCVWLTQQIIRNPDIRIIIDGQEKANAADSVSLIGEWLQLPEIVRLYGEFFKTKPAKDEFTTIQRLTPRRDPTVRALGLDVSEQGKRCDIRVWDDLIGKTNNNEEGIIKVEKHLSASMPIIIPGGTGLYVCTRWNPYDPSTDGFTMSGQPGILRQWKMRTGTWDAPSPRGFFGAYAQDGDEALYPHAVPGEPLHPSVLPEDEIQRYRTTMTHGFFASQILNDPLPEDTQYFSEKDLEGQYFELRDDAGNLHEALTGGLFFMAVDPAGGSKKNSSNDDSTIAVCYIKWFDDYFQTYVCEWVGGRWLPTKLRAEIFALIDLYPIRRIYPEVNMGKEYFLEPLKREARDKGLTLPMEEFSSSLYGTGKKDERIKALQPLYTYRRVFHAAHLKNSKAEEQLFRWQPNGLGHDDYPDVLAHCVHESTKKRLFPADKKHRKISIGGPRLYPRSRV